MKIFRYKVTVNDTVRILSVGVSKMKEYTCILNMDNIEIPKNREIQVSSNSEGYNVNFNVDTTMVEKFIPSGIKYKFAYAITAPEDINIFNIQEEDGKLKKRINEGNEHEFVLNTDLDNHGVTRAFAKSYARKIANTVISKLKGVKGHGIKVDETKLVDIVPQEVIIGGGTCMGSNTIAIGNKDNPNPLG